jgi:hypothetical protein
MIDDTKLRGNRRAERRHGITARLLTSEICTRRRDITILLDVVTFPAMRVVAGFHVDVMPHTSCMNPLCCTLQQQLVLTLKSLIQFCALGLQRLA